MPSCMYLPLIFRRWILSAISLYATQKKIERVFYAFGFSFPEKNEDDDKGWISGKKRIIFEQIFYMFSEV